METTVLGQVEIQDLASSLPTDDVSARLGDKSGSNYCGERQLRITSVGHEDFLSYNEIKKQLVLQSNDKQDEGQLTVTIEAYLVDYVTVKASVTFVTTITACEVTELLQPEMNPNLFYEVSSEEYDFTLKAFD